MKLLQRLFILMLLAGAIVGGIVLAHKKKTQVEKVGIESKAAAVSVKDAVSNTVVAGKQMASALATNAANAAQTGMREAREMATNAAAKTKVAAANVVNSVADVTTNAIHQARQKLESVTD